MKDWNVVVTVEEKHFSDALALLSSYGAVAKTPYYNVVTLKVEDIATFLEQFRQRAQQNPAYGEVFSRIMPCTERFVFQSVEEFEQKAKQAAASFLPRLANHSFHLRMHRRGFQDAMKSQEEAAVLGRYLEQQLQARGTPAEVTFRDPDLILAVETVSQQAGLSLWTREQRSSYTFLKLD